jgi:GNAT superfamily N-acetyltransferase
VDAAIDDIEEALVGHWSYFGRWPKGALVEDAGTLRYETPIPHLPYNAVLRTRLAAHDTDAVIARVVASYRRRNVDFAWWETPSTTPRDLGARLERQGIGLVERATGMSLDLDGWEAQPPRAGVDYAEALDEAGLRDYAELIYSYWELPEESRDLVAEVNRFWGPGKAPVHRWVAYLEGRPVGKTLLSLAAPDGVAAIYGMSVRPEARGRGVASGLTTTALEKARSLGRRRVVLHSTEMAVGVYARAGFVERCPLAVYATTRLWSDRDH